MVSPPGRIAFLPVQPPARRPDDQRFATADALLQKHDFSGAFAALESPARSTDRATRAGALLRIGRGREAAGDTAAALRAFALMSDLDDVFIADTPASLAAAYARCKLLEAHGHLTKLTTEARRIDMNLKASRWPLTAPVYWLYRDDARRWTNENSATTPAEWLAAAVSALWERWEAMPASALPIRAREAMVIASDSVTVISVKTGQTLRALVVTPGFVRNHWLNDAETAAATESVTFSIGNPTGSRTGGTVLRTTTQTDLPWPISVTRRNLSAEDAQFTSRRRMLIGGFALLLMMGLVAGAATIRAVSREFAVARLQSDFVSTVSHEFRTPLTTLRQFTDRLQEGHHLTADDRAICYGAQSRATERLTRLVESLLDFGRIQAGSRPYTLEPLDCADVVAHVVSDFERAQNSTRPIRFRRDGPAPVLADREALSLAVWNLVDNAVKYSRGPASVEVDVARGASHVSVAVRDHGIGIPRAEQKSIFRKFQRGEHARAGGFSGTGLGLAIVDHIVKAHHGRMSVESALGEGSTFTIHLPAS
jgi:signal transduction histidine kinase